MDESRATPQIGDIRSNRWKREHNPRDGVPQNSALFLLYIYTKCFKHIGFNNVCKWHKPIFYASGY